MAISQKCQYALRAVFELAKRHGQGPSKIGEIAEAQAIPARFLEVILSELKHGGFVESRRGNEGGYMLVREPQELTVGDVMQFVEGPISPVDCTSSGSKDKCPLYGDCVFLPLWERVRKAISDVCDKTTFQDLLDQEREKARKFVSSYSI